MSTFSFLSGHTRLEFPRNQERWRKLTIVRVAWLYDVANEFGAVSQWHAGRACPNPEGERVAMIPCNSNKTSWAKVRIGILGRRLIVPNGLKEGETKDRNIRCVTIQYFNRRVPVEGGHSRMIHAINNPC